MRDFVEAPGNMKVTLSLPERNGPGPGVKSLRFELEGKGGTLYIYETN